MKQLSQAFFDDECNYSMQASVDKLELLSRYGVVFKHTENNFGRTVYLFSDGSSMQYMSWGMELKPVDTCPLWRRVLTRGVAA